MANRSSFLGKHQEGSGAGSSMLGCTKKRNTSSRTEMFDGREDTVSRLWLHGDREETSTKSVD